VCKIQPEQAENAAQHGSGARSTFRVLVPALAVVGNTSTAETRHAGSKSQVKALTGLMGVWQIQGALVSLQEHDRYCGAAAESTINAMNTSAVTDQIHDKTTGTARATGIGSLRRNMAGALLATAIGATAVGLTAADHPDGAVAPAPPASRWLKEYIDRAFDPHAPCDYRFDDRFPCDWR
jgi:hypothetical protein